MPAETPADDAAMNPCAPAEAEAANPCDAMAMQELPERTTEVVRIRPTEEQLVMSEEYVKRAAQIAAKTYLTEMDLLRLQKFLLMAFEIASSDRADRQESCFAGAVFT